MTLSAIELEWASTRRAEVDAGHYDTDALAQHIILARYLKVSPFYLEATVRQVAQDLNKFFSYATVPSGSSQCEDNDSGRDAYERGREQQSPV